MNIENAFPSAFIKSADLQNQDVTVTIAAVAMEEVDDQQLPVVRFAGHAKGWVLNKTCAMVIAEALGTETDRWIGQAITLYPTRCEFKGKMTDCIRVRPPQPPQPTTKPAAGPVQF